MLIFICWAINATLREQYNLKMVQNPKLRLCAEHLPLVLRYIYSAELSSYWRHLLEVSFFGAS
jgi:hypothetical protein